MERQKIIITENDVTRMRELNSEGDKGLLKFNMTNACGYEYEDELIDANYLINKYRRYLTWWQSRFAGVEERWISKSDRLKNCVDFLDAQLHLQDFKSAVQLDPRTNYVFGNIDKIREEYEKIYKS